MDDGKFEIETWMNYIIQPFSSQKFDVISFAQLLETKESHVCFSLKPLRRSDNLSHIYYVLEHP
jgi:hypothetical protein